MAETSTVVPGGDLAGRSAEYRRGYWRGWLAGSGWLLCLYCILCVSFVGGVGLWSISIQRDHADRAEAQLADWAKTPVACMTLWPQQCGGEAANLRQRIEWKTAEADGWRSAAVQCHARREVR